MGTGVPLLPPAADQVPAEGGEARVGGLLRLLARQPEVELRERAPGDRARAEQCGRNSRTPRTNDGRHRRHRAPEQRDRGEDREQPGIALGSVPARAGRVLREGVLRSRRRGLRSVPRERNHDGRGARAGPRGLRLRDLAGVLRRDPAPHRATWPKRNRSLRRPARRSAKSRRRRGVSAGGGRRSAPARLESIRRKPNGMPCYGAKGKP